MTIKKNRKVWSWPFQRMSDGPEYACKHGIGHSNGMHGCDGCCCSDPEFPPTKKNNLKYLEAKYNEQNKKNKIL